MGKRIAIVGAGALGGYVGGTLAHHGLDVTLIDMWPEHVEMIRSRGLELDGLTPDEQFTVTEAKTMHLTEVQSLPRGSIDIAMVAVKSYDTEWATMLIRPTLAPGGYVVSLQNCLNEERIAAIVGWGRTVGVIASLISVDLHEAGRVRRTMPKGGQKHTVFRVGEPHGRITPRIEELAEMFSLIDSAKTTSNLWGERWSKLVQNGMGNGVSAASGSSVSTYSRCLSSRTSPARPFAFSAVRTKPPRPKRRWCPVQASRHRSQPTGSNSSSTARICARFVGIHRTRSCSAPAITSPACQTRSRVYAT